MTPGMRSSSHRLMRSISNERSTWPGWPARTPPACGRNRSAGARSPAVAHTSRSQILGQAEGVPLVAGHNAERALRGHPRARGNLGGGSCGPGEKGLITGSDHELHACGPPVGPHLLSRPGYSGQFIAVAAGSRGAARDRELRDAVRRCPRGAEALAVGPQAHAEQLLALGQLGSAILNDPGLHVHPHGPIMAVRCRVGRFLD